MDKNVIIEEDVLEVTDTKTSETQVYTVEDLYRIIKEQSEKIAELTRELAVQFETSVDSAKYHKLWEENEQLKQQLAEKVKRYKVLSKHPNDEFIDLQVGVKLDSHQVVRFLNESYNYIEELRKENRKLTEELNKYKETVQELQESNGRMFDEMLKIRCGEQ